MTALQPVLPPQREATGRRLAAFPALQLRSRRQCGGSEPPTRNPLLVPLPVVVSRQASSFRKEQALEESFPQSATHQDSTARRPPESARGTRWAAHEVFWAARRRPHSTICQPTDSEPTWAVRCLAETVDAAVPLRWTRWTVCVGATPLPVAVVVVADAVAAPPALWPALPFLAPCPVAAAAAASPSLSLRVSRRPVPPLSP
mmetsp:Transcript_42982/g.96767  ORF Transcript_42982/g.96767 Transcript_42982/m.96767 type:complete len:202 (+) Transcript_42982:1605-2210(+)